MKLKIYFYLLLSFIPYFKRKMSFAQIEQIVINDLKTIQYRRVYTHIKISDSTNKIFAITFNVPLKSEDIELKIRLNYTQICGMEIEFSVPKYSVNGVMQEHNLINQIITNLEGQIGSIFITM